MNINIFGLLLTNSINNNNIQNKNKLLTVINDNKKLKQEKNSSLISKNDYYFNNFIIKRNENDKNYETYLINRLLLYKTWKKTKSLIDLQNLVEFKTIEYNNVPDIYTINIIRNTKLKS